jgi:hypothetical protein
MRYSEKTQFTLLTDREIPNGRMESAAVRKILRSNRGHSCRHHLAGELKPSKVAASSILQIGMAGEQ